MKVEKLHAFTGRGRHERYPSTQSIGVPAGTHLNFKILGTGYQQEKNGGYR